METTAQTSAPRAICAHCGLPVAAPGTRDSGSLYCCQACRLVALIVGKKPGEQGGQLLRLGLGTLLAMNIMMISLLLYSGSVEAPAVAVFRLVLLGLTTPALLILLPPFLAGALRECSARNLSLDALIACGSLSAFSVSAVNALRGTGAIYFDTATMLPVLVTFGKIIESCAKTRAADLLNSLQTLLPAAALRVSAAGPAEVEIASLRCGDLIQVRPGERVAVDGRIVEGTSSIEEAAFTGEFLPRLCQPGDHVIAGTINGTGSLTVLAERTGADLLLHGIVTMIHDAWRTPSTAERIAERAANVFVPALVTIALGSVACWWLLGNPVQGLLSALSVLVVACPCTMGIATPLATSLAIARAARAGIVVRGGAVMERLAKTDLIYFDKTGTLTTGQPVVEDIQIIDPGVERSELLGRLATLESVGGHVLGKAVASAAQSFGCPIGSVSGTRVVPGSGISGTVTWQGATKQVVAGTGVFVRSDSGLLSEVAGAPGGSLLQEENRTVIEVAWDGQLRSRLLLSDAVRPDARSCIRSLNRSGIQTVLLSGDSLAAASSIAQKTGVSRIEAPRTPAQKLRAITDSLAEGRTVAMVGDGINDAPALAAAPLGIAIGAGTDLAKQSCNIVILSDRLAQVPWLIDLSRRTSAIIRGNFAWSFGYNAIALAAAVAGMLHPLLAALAMVCSSLTVLGNSLRIMKYPDDATLRRQ